MPDLDRIAREIADDTFSATHVPEMHRRLHVVTLAALRRVEAETREEWRPIDTAPKDGTPVDLWCQPTGISTGPGRVTDCWFSGGNWWQYDEHGDDQCRSGVHNATHWMPLPPPPSKEGEA